MFRLMDEIFIKSLQSVQKIIINDKHCFELYGYDILLDADLKPYKKSPLQIQYLIYLLNIDLFKLKKKVAN